MGAVHSPTIGAAARRRLGDHPSPPGASTRKSVRTLDVIMLAIAGGRERTSVELEQLLASAGFRTTGTRPTPSPLRIVEAVAV